MKSKLKTETNTFAIEARILLSFAAVHGGVNAVHADAFFEHGQWWVCHVPTGMIWAVVDASPGVDGFDFEQVCDGDV